VSGAIPSTENVAIRAKMGAWMLSSILEHRTGVEYVRVHVTVPYQTQYEDAETEELIISDMQHMTYEFMVPKAWSYWIVADGGIYFPEKVVVENAALGEDAIEIPVAWECEDAINKPTYRITSYGGKENHVMWNSMEPGKSFDDDGTPSLTIMLEKQEYIISDTPGELPDIASHLRNVCYNAAWQDTTQFSVKSDHISVAGRTLLADSLEHTGIGVGPSMWEIEHIGEKIQETAYNQTYKSEVPLQIDVKNGRYETEAKVIYKADISNVGSVTEKQVEGKETNEINIHTPVVCVPIIQADHKDMYQCENVPEGNTVLVLDEEGKHSDFVLRIDNKGYHSDKKGYGERTYIDFLAQKDGKKQNEVCFPFSVWVDAENDGDSANDVYLEAGEWYLLGSGEQRFYMPVWTKEGCYEIMFRSVAINGVGLEEKKEEYCNSQGSHYVAEGKIKVYLTGRLYDFAVNGIGGSAMWEEVKQEELCYTVGLQESSGSIWDTVPLRTGVHPSYRNGGGVSMGGFIDFRLKSIGRSFEADTILTVIPRFVSVQDGNYRTVDVYYEKETESGIFLKRWDGDSQCILLMMKENAKSDRQYLEELQLTEEGKRIIDLYESEIENTIREWQGRFYLPDKLYVAKEGADVLGYQAQFGLTFTEEFWVLNEPLMLSFEMCIENEQGDILYYGMIPDNIVNNIWQREAKSSYREDGKGNRFRILGGETAVIYPGDSAKKDYIIYGIY